MMKKIAILAAVVATATVLYAGPKPSKEVHVPIDKPMTQAAWYVGAYGGGSFWQGDISKEHNLGREITMKEKRKIGWDAGIKVGYDFNTAAPVRLVLEADAMFTGFNRNIEILDGARLAGTVKFNFQSFSLMGNALAKFDCGAFQPYVGAGAGFHTTRMEAKWPDGWVEKENGNGFAWQLLAGSDYKLDANWALFAEYKWVNYELPSKWTDMGVKSRIGQHLVNLGVR